jgi:putative membrane protein
MALGAALIVAVPAAWPAAPVLVAIAVALGLDAFAAAGLRLDPHDGRVIVRARHRAARITLVARRRRVQELGVSRTILQRRAGLATVSIAVARGTRLGVRHVDPPLADEFLSAFDPHAWR